MQNLINSYLGDYLLTDFLGAGGMGEVYLGIHEKIERKVAIKILTCFEPGSNYNQRFLNEARIQAGLHHPNIATLYDFMEFQGRPCIIMEYVDGQTIYERIQACGRLPLKEAIRIFRDVAQAIAHIHQKGVLHRDIKSNNIKINSSGQVKLLDFGIAKDTVTPKLTLDGHYVGSLHYLSPEQLMGKPIGRQSDIWSLGILLYEMVSGKLPFESNSLNELYMSIKDAKHISVSTIHPDIPPQIQKTINRCLKRKPAQRFSCAEELINALDSVIREQMPPGTWKPEKGTFLLGLSALRLRLKDNRIWLAAGLIFTILLLIGAFLRYSDNDRPGQEQAGPTRSPSTGLPPPVSSPIKLTRVKIDTIDGRADVYENNEYIGKTPYIKHAPTGSEIKIRLKRKGYQDKVIHFEVGEIDSQYSYSLNKVSP